MYVLLVRMSTSVIFIHYTQLGSQSPNPQELHRNMVTFAVNINSINNKNSAVIEAGKFCLKVLYPF